MVRGLQYEQGQEQEHFQNQSTGRLLLDQEENIIYPVTEGCNSEYTKESYKNSFNRFLKHIKVDDLQVLIDFGDKVLEQLIIKYVIHARDTKKLSRAQLRPNYMLYFTFVN